MEKLKSKKATATFAIIALAGGIIFSGINLTGNAINQSNLFFKPLFIIGFLLICCSIVLGLYSIRKKE